MVRDLPDSPSVTRPDAHNPENRFIFKVRRPALSHCPSPPAGLKQWLVSGWDEYGTAPQVRESLNIVEAGKTRTIRFNDEPARAEAFTVWTAERAAWEEAEARERGALAGFERIYALHGQI